MIPPARLVGDLEENAQISGNGVLERRMADFAVWYYKNVKMLPPDNLKLRLEFQEKSTWILLELNALLLERLREKTGSKYLFMPNGINVS
jgi:hypothetical protein